MKKFYSGVLLLSFGVYLNVNTAAASVADYSCSANGRTVSWRDVRSFFDAEAIKNTIFQQGCKYAQRKISNSHGNDVEILGQMPILDSSQLSSFVSCRRRDEVPMKILGAHQPSNRQSLFPYFHNFQAYKVSENTNYELYQEDQSRRGTNRLDKWYSQWDIRGGSRTTGYEYYTGKLIENQELRLFINGRRNGESTFGPLTFKRSLSPYLIHSTMTRGERVFSFSISGSFTAGFSPVDYRAKLPSAKIEGEYCYAADAWYAITERNTRPSIAGIIKTSTNYSVNASDEHTTNDFLQYNWEFVGANGRTMLMNGRTVNVSDSLFGNSVTVNVIVSDGNLSSIAGQTFQLNSYIEPIDPFYPPCEGCMIP